MHDKKKISYSFNLNETYTIDGVRYANNARYINCNTVDPNLAPRVMFISGDHRIGLYAKTDIVMGQELTFDYDYNDAHLASVGVDVDEPQSNSERTGMTSLPPGSTVNAHTVTHGRMKGHSQRALATVRGSGSSHGDAPGDSRKLLRVTSNSSIDSSSTTISSCASLSRTTQPSPRVTSAVTTNTTAAVSKSTSNISIPVAARRTLSGLEPSANGGRKRKRPLSPFTSSDLIKRESFGR
mgnify:CR=1 FL=1